MNKTVALVVLGFLVFFTSVYEDAEDVLGLDAYLYPSSEAVIHFIGAIFMVVALVIAYRLGKSRR